jgi:CheY-like chemotaxis protein
MVLEEQGHNAVGVPTPDEALVLLEKETFDVIVTEFKLTGTTGPEFIARLREAAPGTPVVLLSGYVDALGLNERSTGADVVLMKNSLETHHLVHTVSRLLRLKPTVKRARKKPAVSETPALRRVQSRNGTNN